MTGWLTVSWDLIAAGILVDAKKLDVEQPLKNSMTLMINRRK